MIDSSGEAVPLPWAIPSILTIHRENQLSLGYDTNILCFMAMHGDDRTRRVRGEQYVTSLGAQPERVEQPLEPRKTADQFWKMHLPPHWTQRRDDPHGPAGLRGHQRPENRLDVEARAIDVRKVCGVFGEDGRQIGPRKDDALRAGVEQRVRQSRQATVVRF